MNDAQVARGAAAKNLGDVVGGCGAFLKAAEITAPPFHEISAMANWLNTAPELKNGLDFVDREPYFKPLARLMENRIKEASPTDLSRLAWLHLHSGDKSRAIEISDIGLKADANNIYCQRLSRKLSSDHHHI